MKDTIEYYYNIEVNNLEEMDGKYHFRIDNDDYFFVYYNRSMDELEDIIEICNELINKGISVNKLVLNVDNKFLTKVDEYNYILFMCNNIKEEYDIFDMVEFMDHLVVNSVGSKVYRNNWGNLWSSKIDYLEEQVSRVVIDKEIINNSFNYYISLAECATCYVLNTIRVYGRVSNSRLVLSHRRVYYPNYKLNYLNPLSFIFDLEVRDIAEYIKAMFLKSSLEETLDELDGYLKVRHLSVFDAQMLMGRILYPSYYFDLYEGIIEKKEDDSKLMEVIERVDDYEIFLKKVYLLINKYTQITKIDFLID